jgi:tetratricopeptide (TPR) repeat protein
MRNDDAAIAAFRSRLKSILMTSSPTTISAASIGKSASTTTRSRRSTSNSRSIRSTSSPTPISGQMYAEWHKYDLAAPELEKSASPDARTIPSCRSALGDAYLNLGQDDKALAAFDHAVEISPTPLIWNNIAYQLSLKNAHLDRAQQYAESAVSPRPRLAQRFARSLTPATLAAGSSLIAYWDTLGWVRIQRGQSRQSGKVCRRRLGDWASRRSRRPSGTDLREARRERSRARTYALSMNGLRPISRNSRPAGCARRRQTPRPTPLVAHYKRRTAAPQHHRLRQGQAEPATPIFHPIE